MARVVSRRLARVAALALLLTANAGGVLAESPASSATALQSANQTDAAFLPDFATPGAGVSVFSSATGAISSALAGQGHLTIERLRVSSGDSLPDANGPQIVQVQVGTLTYTDDLGLEAQLNAGTAEFFDAGSSTTIKNAGSVPAVVVRTVLAPAPVGDFSEPVAAAVPQQQAARNLTQQATPVASPEAAGPPSSGIGKLIDSDVDNLPASGQQLSAATVMLAPNATLDITNATGPIGIRVDDGNLTVERPGKADSILADANSVVLPTGITGTLANENSTAIWLQIGSISGAAAGNSESNSSNDEGDQTGARPGNATPTVEPNTDSGQAVTPQPTPAVNPTEAPAENGGATPTQATGGANDEIGTRGGSKEPTATEESGTPENQTTTGSSDAAQFIPSDDAMKQIGLLPAQGEEQQEITDPGQNLFYFSNASDAKTTLTKYNWQSALASGYDSNSQETQWGEVDALQISVDIFPGSDDATNFFNYIRDDVFQGGASHSVDLGKLTGVDAEMRESFYDSDNKVNDGVMVIRSGSYVISIYASGTDLNAIGIMEAIAKLIFPLQK